MRAVRRKCIVRSHSKIFIGHFFTSFPMMLQIRHFFTDFAVSLFPNAKLISLSLFFRDLLQAQQSLDKTFLARRLNCFPRDYLNDSSLFALTAALQILLPLRFLQNHLSTPSTLMQFSLHPLIPLFCLSLRRPLLNFMISLFFALSADSSRLFSLHCTPCSSQFAFSAFSTLTFPRWLAFLRTLISSNSKNFVFLCVLPLFAWSRSLVRSLYQFCELAFSRTHSTFTISRVKLCIVALVFSVFLRAVTLFTDFNVSLFFVLSQGFTVFLPLRYLTNCDLARNNLPPLLK